MGHQTVEPQNKAQQMPVLAKTGGGTRMAPKLGPNLHPQ
jgi:hypothetical protein